MKPERLTYKSEFAFIETEPLKYAPTKPIVTANGDDESLFNLVDVLNKLGKFEDVEEKLGIDPAIVFKALENGFYGLSSCVTVEYLNEKKRIEGESGDILFLERTDEPFTRIALEYSKYGFNTYYWAIIVFGYSREKDAIVEVGRFSSLDYGKTWALTKGELELL
jgi:hypothetical protein